MPWLAGCLAFALHATTLSRNYNGDSFDFAEMVENSAWSLLIYPFHLMPGPLAWGFYHLLQSVGWAGRAIAPLQLLNALGGALCVALMARILQRLGIGACVVIAVTAGFAASFGKWTLSTQAEFVTIPLAAALWVWDLLLNQADPGSRPNWRAVELGLATALAPLAYASSASLALVVTGVVMAWMVWQAMQGNANLGDLALFSAAFSQGQGLMRSLLSNVGLLYGSSLFLSDLFEFLALEPQVVDKPGALATLPAPGMAAGLQPVGRDGAGQ